MRPVPPYSHVLQVAMQPADARPDHDVSGKRAGPRESIDAAVRAGMTMRSARSRQACASSGWTSSTCTCSINPCRTSGRGSWRRGHGMAARMTAACGSAPWARFCRRDDASKAESSSRPASGGQSSSTVTERIGHSPAERPRYWGAIGVSGHNGFPRARHSSTVQSFDLFPHCPVQLETTPWMGCTPK
jgi:hypothetical protein